MAPPDLRRPYKRPAISDQQRRREIALLRQSHHRSDSQNRARSLASSVVSLQPEPDVGPECDPKPDKREAMSVVEASRLKGAEARRWFSQQLMFPEWMIDIPHNLDRDWHAHYQNGNTPLALVWKDEFSSQYVIDTDSNGQVPVQQQVVLELQDDGKLITSDDPPVVLWYADADLLQEWGVQPASLLRFAVRDEAVRLADGKLQFGDMQFTGKPNRARAFADSYSKIFFQYTARHSPVRFGDLITSIQPDHNNDSRSTDIDMAS